MNDIIWMSADDIRKQVVVESLRSRRNDLRTAASKCRKAYTKDYMLTPMNWLAEAYEEAADLLDARLTQITSAALPPSHSETP